MTEHERDNAYATLSYLAYSVAALTELDNRYNLTSGWSVRNSVDRNGFPILIVSVLSISTPPAGEDRLLESERDCPTNNINHLVPYLAHVVEEHVKTAQAVFQPRLDPGD